MKTNIYLVKFVGINELYFKVLNEDMSQYEFTSYLHNATCFNTQTTAKIFIGRNKLNLNKIYLVDIDGNVIKWGE